MSAFENFRKFFRPTDATIALASDPFIVIDRERAIEKLKLDSRAEQNGSNNFPAPNAEGWDDVESEIVAEMSEHATRAQIDAAANHRLYGERLSELALLRELSTITGASAQALGDYRTTVINREGRLALAKDAIRESYAELAAFKMEHALERPAHRGLHPAYAWSTIGVSWFVESAFNTAFLRVNDDLGVLGGFIAAAVIAAVNVGGSALVGRYWWPYLFFKYPFQRSLALAGSALWLIALFLWNLLAGHFRDAKAAGLESPESAALQLFWNSPLQFDSVYSYGLLGAGIAFAVVSAVASFKLDDPYPGYGAIYRRHEDRCEAYADEIELALEELRETRDEAIAAATELRDQLGVQFRERGQIIAAREAHRNRFREHQDYLDDVGNALLSHYRANNIRARSEPAPGHFNTKWELRRTELPLIADEPSIDEEVLRAQEALKESIETISAAYDDAIQAFEHLNKIKASLTHG